MAPIAIQMTDQIAIKIMVMIVIYHLDKTVLKIQMDHSSSDNIA
jgi:hypothetical protein